MSAALRLASLVAAVALATSPARSRAQISQQGRSTAIPAASFALSTKSEAARRAFDAGYDAYLEYDWVRAAREMHRAFTEDTTLRLARAFELFLTQPVAPKPLADSIARLQIQNGSPNLIESLFFTQLRERAAGDPANALIVDAMARAVPDENRILADSHERFGAGTPARGADARILRNREPQSYRAQAFVALALDPRRDSSEAFQAMGEALRLGGDKPFAHYAAGDLLSRAGRYPEAIAHYTHAIQLDSNYYVAAWFRGNVELYTRRIADARADFQLAATRAAYPPNKATMQRAAALTYLYDGDPARAERELGQVAQMLSAQGNVPGAVAVAHRDLEYVAAGRHDAKSVATHVAARQRSAEPGSGSGGGLDVYWDAMSWSTAGEPARAREALDQLERLVASKDYSPAAGDLNAARAMVLIAEHKEDQALALANGTPMNAHWGAIVAYRVLSARGQTDEAAKRLRAIFDTGGYAVDALALPVAYSMWGKAIGR
jgi:tetratricopeptide (TPR) repeat protein